MFGIFSMLFSSGGESFWERLASWYQNSLLHEILTYIGETYFTVELGAYENISIAPGSAAAVRNLILALAFGVILATVLTAYLRNILGGFVRKLLREEATSPDRAKTLTELGYFRSTTIRRELTRGSVLRMVVRCREKEEAEATLQAAETVLQETETSLQDAEKVAGKGSEVFLQDAENVAADGSEETPKKAENAHTSFKLSKSSAYQTAKIDFTTARFYIPEELRYRADVRFDRAGSGWRAVILTAIATIVVAALLCWLLPDILQFADNIISMTSPS